MGNDRRVRRRIRRSGVSVAGLITAGVATVGPSDLVVAFPVNDAGTCGIGVPVLNYRFAGTWSAPDRAAFVMGVERWDHFRNRDNAVFIDSIEVAAGGVPVTRDLTPGATSATTCANGVPTSIVIGDTTDVARSAAHEAGHAHGLSHTGNDDALDPVTGAQGTQPVMDGCAVSTGQVTSDDRLQYAHEREFDSTFTQAVGFENGNTGWTGHLQPATGSPNPGTRFMKVPDGTTLSSAWGRVTTAPANLTVRTDYKGGGSNKTKFEFRQINYPAPGNCNAASTPAFNPNTHNWRDPTQGIITTWSHVLPPSPAAWAFDSWNLIAIWSTWHGFDYRVHAFSDTGGDLFIDDLELT